MTEMGKYIFIEGDEGAGKGEQTDRTVKTGAPNAHSLGVGTTFGLAQGSGSPPGLLTHSQRWRSGLQTVMTAEPIPMPRCGTAL